MSIASTLGKLTRPLRAGEQTLILHKAGFEAVPQTLAVTSPAFADRAPLPLRYTVSGEDISPPLNWDNLPSGTRELLLIVEDYDISLPKPMVHLIVYGLRPEAGGFPEGALPSRDMPASDPTLKLGKNGLGFARYDGPAAPPGHGVHHYVFEMFALDRELSFDMPPNKKTVLDAIRGNVLATGSLTGTFERK